MPFSINKLICGDASLMPLLVLSFLTMLGGCTGTHHPIAELDSVGALKTQLKLSENRGVPVIWRYKGTQGGHHYFLEYSMQYFPETWSYRISSDIVILPNDIIIPYTEDESYAKGLKAFMGDSYYDYSLDYGVDGHPIVIGEQKK